MPVAGLQALEKISFETSSIHHNRKRPHSKVEEPDYLSHPKISSHKQQWTAVPVEAAYPLHPVNMKGNHLLFHQVAEQSFQIFQRDFFIPSDLLNGQIPVKLFCQP